MQYWATIIGILHDMAPLCVTQLTVDTSAYDSPDIIIW